MYILILFFYKKVYSDELKIDYCFCFYFEIYLVNSDGLIDIVVVYFLCILNKCLKVFFEGNDFCL